MSPVQPPRASLGILTYSTKPLRPQSFLCPEGEFQGSQEWKGGILPNIFWEQVLVIRLLIAHTGGLDACYLQRQPVLFWKLCWQFRCGTESSFHPLALTLGMKAPEPS